MEECCSEKIFHHKGTEIFQTAPGKVFIVPFCHENLLLPGSPPENIEREQNDY